MILLDGDIIKKRKYLLLTMKNAEKFKDHNLYDVLHRERQYKMHIKRVNDIYTKTRNSNQQQKLE